MSARADATARNLLQLTTRLMRRVAAELRKSDSRLSPMQAAILSRIDEGPCSLTELSQRLAVRLPTASQSVSVLVGRGWIDRQRSPEDRRRILFGLTPDGRRALKAMKRRAETFVAAMLEGLPASEHARINAALAALQSSIQPAAEDACTR